MPGSMTVITWLVGAAESDGCDVATNGADSCILSGEEFVTKLLLVPVLSENDAVLSRNVRIALSRVSSAFCTDSFTTFMVFELSTSTMPTLPSEILLPSAKKLPLLNHLSSIDLRNTLASHDNYHLKN